MSECIVKDTDNKECECKCNHSSGSCDSNSSGKTCTPCKLNEWVDWIIVYELAVIILILLCIYSERENPTEKQMQKE